MLTWKNCRVVFCIIGGIILSQAELASAQVKEYVFSQSMVKYDTMVISGGTVLGTTANKDESFNGNPIGFTFNFNAINYTQFSVNTDGFIVLGASASSSPFQALSSGASNNVVAAFNTNLGAREVSDLQFKTLGTAPNRILIVQWTRYQKYEQVLLNTSNAGDSWDFQIRLHETTNVIQAVYGTMINGAKAGVMQVGLRGSSPNYFNNRTTTTDWLNTTAATANNATCKVKGTDTLPTIVPPSGLTFTWTPPPLKPFAFKSVTTVQADVSSVERGSFDNKIICIQVALSGNTGTACTLNEIKLTYSGTSDFITDVSKVKIYSTGRNSVFDTTTLFDSTSDMSSLFEGNAQLIGGDNTNYFWVAFDIPPTATKANRLDAQCVAVTISPGGVKIPIESNPTGHRIISPWSRVADFPGVEGLYSTNFSIDKKGYVGLGSAKDFWEYDPEKDEWKRKADFPGGTRVRPVEFSIGNKGYVGPGTAKDFWEYDPVADQWTRKADYPGNGTYACGGFSIGAKGYIGTGTNSDWNAIYKDFWEYDPVADHWTQKADFQGPATQGVTGFSIGGKGYLGMGGNYATKFWEYDPVADQWVQKPDGPYGLSAADGFSIGNKGYIATGNWDNNDFWEYNSDEMTWTKKEDIPGARNFAVGFSIGSRGYVGAGRYVADFWEYSLPPSIPAPAFTANHTSICAGESITFTDQSSGLITRRQWLFPGGVPDSSKDVNPVVTYTTGGVYTVTLSVGNGSGDSVVTRQNYIIVEPLPVIHVSDVTICPPDTVTQLSVSGDGATYSWTPPEGLSCTDCQRPYASPKKTTSYIVTARSASGCEAVDTVTVYVAAKVVANAGQDVEICQGAKTQLSASGGTSYSWSPTDSLSNSLVANPIAKPSVTTTYRVTVSSGSCATGIDSVTVTVHPNPPPPKITPNGNTLQSSLAEKYQWYRNDTLISGATFQNYTVTLDGYYRVMITDSNGCSSSSGAKKITVGVGSDEMEPHNFTLSQNYPNPFSQLSVVSYQLSAGSRGIFVARDMLGRIMYRTKVNNTSTQITIDAINWPAGMYLYSLTDGMHVQSRMMMVSK